jgi:ribosomal protein L22
MVSAAQGEEVSLKPQNLIQAAEADLKRLKMNTTDYRFYFGQCHQYAFHRQHVRGATTVAGILKRAAKAAEKRKPIKTHKRYTITIYANPGLIREALMLLEPT